jgi:hypothetical protein
MVHYGGRRPQKPLVEIEAMITKRRISRIFSSSYEEIF